MSFDHCSMLSFHQPKIAELWGVRIFLHQRNGVFLPTRKSLVVVTSNWIFEVKSKWKDSPNQNCTLSPTLTNPKLNIFTYPCHALSFIFLHTQNSIYVYVIYFLLRCFSYPKILENSTMLLAHLSFSLCHWIHGRQSFLPNDDRQPRGGIFFSMEKSGLFCFFSKNVNPNEHVENLNYWLVFVRILSMVFLKCNMIG